MWNSSLVRKVFMKRTKADRQKGLGYQVEAALNLVRPAERKPESVFRSRQHRMNVAALACVCCGRFGRSQDAHLNLLAAGKGMGLKASDALSVPLCCDGPGYRGCHHQLDQSGFYDKATSAAYQIQWLQETRDQLRALGQWPHAAEADLQRLLGAYLSRDE